MYVYSSYNNMCILDYSLDISLCMGTKGRYEKGCHWSIDTQGEGLLTAYDPYWIDQLMGSLWRSRCSKNGWGHPIIIN